MIAGLSGMLAPKLMSLYGTYANRTVASLREEDITSIASAFGKDIEPGHPLIQDTVRALTSDDVDTVAEALAKPEVYAKIVSLYKGYDASSRSLRQVPMQCRDCQTLSFMSPDSKHFVCPDCGRQVQLSEQQLSHLSSLYKEPEHGQESHPQR